MIKVLMTAVFALGLAHAQNATPNPKLDDAQITKVLKTLNEGEVDQAKVAKGKTKNDDIKSFAKMMIDQHKQNEKDMKALAKKTKIGMKDSELADTLKKDAKNMKSDMKKADSFDKTYADTQVAVHQKALDTLNNSLIPSAENPDLKAFLEKTRDTVATHLEEAKTLQSKFQ